MIKIIVQHFQIPKILKPYIFVFIIRFSVDPVIYRVSFQNLIFLKKGIFTALDLRNVNDLPGLKLISRKRGPGRRTDHCVFFCCLLLGIFRSFSLNLSVLFIICKLLFLSQDFFIQALDLLFHLTDGF